MDQYAACQNLINCIKIHECSESALNFSRKDKITYSYVYVSVSVSVSVCVSVSVSVIVSVSVSVYVNVAGTFQIYVENTFISPSICLAALTALS